MSSWINWARTATKELCPDCKSDYLSKSGNNKFCRTCQFFKKEYGV